MLQPVRPEMARVGLLRIVCWAGKNFPAFPSSLPSPLHVWVHMFPARLC